MQYLLSCPIYGFPFHISMDYSTRKFIQIIAFVMAKILFALLQSFFLLKPVENTLILLHFLATLSD